MLAQGRSGDSLMSFSGRHRFHSHSSLLLWRCPVTTSPAISVSARTGCYAGLLAFGCVMTALLFDLPILVFGALLLGLPAVILAIAGWCEVWRSAGQKRGAGLAQGGIVASVLAVLVGLMVGST
jgi:hypothetical protein